MNAQKSRNLRENERHKMPISRVPINKACKYHFNDYHFTRVPFDDDVTKRIFVWICVLER